MQKNGFWIAAVVIISVIFGTIYATVQQSLRLSANDPQVQLAEDAATKLNHGQTPISVIGPEVDAAHSLASFINVYDKTGKPVVGSGVVGDAVLAAPPTGVLTAADGKDYSYVTWQPLKDVRLATVTVATKGYYVLSARSLKEVEKRENRVFWLSATGWLIAIIVVGASYWLTTKR